MWRTILFVIGLAAATLPTASFADLRSEFRDKDPKSCKIEIFAPARAACIAARTDERLMRVEELISGATATLQGATPDQLRRFEESLRGSQSAWRAALFDECYMVSDGDALDFERCRYHATRAREIRVVATLNEQLAPLSGQTYSIPPSSSLVIYVPVEPRGALDPDLDAFLPVVIPPTPD